MHERLPEQNNILPMIFMHKVSSMFGSNEPWVFCWISDLTAPQDYLHILGPGDIYWIRICESGAWKSVFSNVPQWFDPGLHQARVTTDVAHCSVSRCKCKCWMICAAPPAPLSFVGQVTIQSTYWALTVARNWAELLILTTILWDRQQDPFYKWVHWDLEKESDWLKVTHLIRSPQILNPGLSDSRACVCPDCPETLPWVMGRGEDTRQIHETLPHMIKWI